jgi:hypothetical protein
MSVMKAERKIYNLKYKRNFSSVAAPSLALEKTGIGIGNAEIAYGYDYWGGGGSG